MRYRAPKPVILASTSPRRIELLRQAGVDIEIRPPGTDETLVPGELPKAMVARLAREKAEAVLGEYSGKDCIVIAADTTVVSPDGKKILGKPESPADARRMLARLAGASHLVFTGYCILEAKGGRVLRKHVRVVKSRVKLRKLGAATIAAYVASGEPLDKAGSYGAQGIGAAFIESIQGSYTNVVGLPMSQLLEDLEQIFSFKPMAPNSRAKK